MHLAGRDLTQIDVNGMLCSLENDWLNLAGDDKTLKLAQTGRLPSTS